MQLETRYARLGRDRIAYQTLGEGPLVLVNAPGSFSHADVVFEDPAAVLYYRRLASFAKVIHFDRRGTGGSDPAPSDARPPSELYVEELTAVLDAAGVERAAILAMFDVGPMAIWFAATAPQRTAALILANTSARHLAADDYPIGIPPQVAEPLRAAMEESWGTEELVRWLVPSRADDQRFCRWHAKLQRATTSPQTVQAFLHASYSVDARLLLPRVKAPMLVLHRRQFQLVPIAHGRYLAEHIAGARLVETTATASWAPSTTRRGRSAARPRSLRTCAGWGSGSGPGCIPARSSCATATWGHRCAHRGAGDGGRSAWGDPGVQDRARSGGGSGIPLRDRGGHRLKGVQGEWQLLAVAGP